MQYPRAQRLLIAYPGREGGCYARFLPCQDDSTFRRRLNVVLFSKTPTRVGYRTTPQALANFAVTVSRDLMEGFMRYHRLYGQSWARGLLNALSRTGKA